MALLRESCELAKAFGEFSSSFPTGWLLHSSQHHSGQRMYESLSSDTPPTILTALCLRYYATDILIMSIYISLRKHATTNNTSATFPTIAHADVRLNTSITNFRRALQNFTDSSAPSSITPAIHIGLKAESLRWIAWPLSMIMLAEEVRGSDRVYFEYLMKETGRISGYAVLGDVKRNWPDDIRVRNVVTKHGTTESS